jgi:pimeloyl-ACP methyl ester carboxylesterase
MRSTERAGEFHHGRTEHSNTQRLLLGGSGTPLVLPHGLSGTWRVWTPILPLVETHHAVFALTLPGHAGGPPLPAEDPPSVAALVDGVAAELDRLGIDKAHFAGNSLGGWISLELARRGRARSVVLFGPAGAWRAIIDPG